MPHFTLQMTSDGPVLNAVVGVSEARLTALSTIGQEIPESIQVRALVDTGANVTCIEPSVLEALHLTPRGKVHMLTPSTGSTPHPCDQFDVSLFISGAAGGSSPLLSPNLLVIAAARDSLGRGLKGLIGRDILEHCLLHYNGITGLFTLAY